MHGPEAARIMRKELGFRGAIIGICIVCIGGMAISKCKCMYYIYMYVYSSVNGSPETVSRMR